MFNLNLVLICLVMSPCMSDDKNIRLKTLNEYMESRRKSSYRLEINSIQFQVTCVSTEIGASTSALSNETASGTPDLSSCCSKE